MIFRLLCSLGVAGIFLLPASGATSTKTRFGLWVEAEGTVQPFRDRPHFERFRSFVGSAKFTDLYCQVYRGGRAWFPTLLADATPYWESRGQGLDPLRETITLAHANGKRVHAWVNVFNITANASAPILQVVGRDAVLVDNYKNSLLDYDEKGRPPGEVGKYFQLGTPALWLNPASSSVRRYILETVRDLVVAHPELDGIHLDMIRYPYAIPIKPSSQFPGGIDIGYSDSSIAAFYEAYPELQAARKKDELPRGEKWEDWRRAQVTLMVAEIRDLLNRIAPRMELSVAGLAWPDRAYQNAFQDWRGWLQGGLVHSVLPMNYTRDNQMAAYVTKQAVAFAATGEVLVGLGAWLMLDNHAALVEQVENSLRLGAGGVVLFSYSNMENERGRELLRKVAQTVGEY